MNNFRKYQILGVFYVLTSIILGALGAHLLKNLLSTQQLQSFETGIRFQMYMGLGLLILPLMKEVNFNKISMLLIALGTLLFSFSIYLLALQNILNANLSFLGPVTPLGGLLMISGWAWILFSLIKNN